MASEENIAEWSFFDAARRRRMGEAQYEVRSITAAMSVDLSNNNDNNLSNKYDNNLIPLIT